MIKRFLRWCRGPYCEKCGAPDRDHWEHNGDLQDYPTWEWVWIGCPER